MNIKPKTRPLATVQFMKNMELVYNKIIRSSIFFLLPFK
jgi:hypothetical protein